MASTPNVVEWLTLGVATAGTFLTALIGAWSIKRKDREFFDVHIEWEWTGYGRYPELPFIYVQNRSTHMLSIIELTWGTGLFRVTPERGTAVFYQDLADLNFPYEIKPGETTKIFLDESAAKSAYCKIKPRAERMPWLRKPALWLRLKTIRGTYRLIPGEKALPWDERPTWMTGQDADV